MQRIRTIDYLLASIDHVHSFNKCNGNNGELIKLLWVGRHTISQLLSVTRAKEACREKSHIILKVVNRNILIKRLGQFGPYL